MVDKDKRYDQIIVKDWNNIQTRKIENSYAPLRKIASYNATSPLEGLKTHYLHEDGVERPTHRAESEIRQIVELDQADNTLADSESVGGPLV